MKCEAGFEAHFIPRALRFAAGLAMRNFGHVAEVKPGVQSMSIREPVGVAGLIIPWNSPAYLSIRSLVPALAAGCTAAIKMPHVAAQITQLMSEIIASVKEIPQGVVNIFIESGAEGAKLLVSSPQVKVVSFTGSTATGRAISKAAAGTFRRLNLELGGKTPHLNISPLEFMQRLVALHERTHQRLHHRCQSRQSDARFGSKAPVECARLGFVGFAAFCSLFVDQGGAVRDATHVACAPRL